MSVADRRNASVGASSSDRTADRSWLENVWSLHAGDIWAYAARRIGPESAADIVSNTFLVAWRRRTDAPRRPLPWLYGIARLVIKEEQRRYRRSERLEIRLVTFGEDSRNSDPADEALNRRQALDAFEALDDQDREVLMLSAWEGLRGAEAASALGISHAAFRVRRIRARLRLQHTLDALDDRIGLARKERE